MVNFEETFISQPVYIIFYSVANFFLPLVILLTLYSFICKTIWESARYRTGRVSGTGQGECQVQDRESVRYRTGRVSGTGQGECQVQDRESVRYRTGRVSGTRQQECQVQDRENVRYWTARVSGTGQRKCQVQDKKSEEYIEHLDTVSYRQKTYSIVVLMSVFPHINGSI